MKNNYWIIFGLLLSTSVLAQQVTSSPAAAPSATPTQGSAAAKTNAPPASPNKKKAGKKNVAKKKDAASQLKTVPLVTGQATVIASNVNVRGQAKLNSEVIGRLTKGQAVMVLEEVVLKKSGPDEPSA